MATGIPPSTLWREDALDLVTLVDVMQEAANRAE